MRKMMFFMFTLLMLSVASVNAQVRIGGLNDPHPSAVLDLNPDTGNSIKGLLLPHVALGYVTDTTTISKPATGLMVFDTKTNQLAVWNGVLWVYLGSSNSSLDKGNLKIVTQPAVFSFVERPGIDPNPTLSVIATNPTSSSPAITYQWYSKKLNSSDDFSVISGATTATYTPDFGADTYGLYQYICRIAQRDSILNSNIAEIAYSCGAKTISGGWLTFMCHNLGADETKTIAEQMSYKPENNEDPTVYGNLYQWNRKADGHENRQFTVDDYYTTNSGLPNSELDEYGQVLESSDAYGKFIARVNEDCSWRQYDNPDKQEGFLDPDWSWTVNNPCPTGWRLLTVEDWQDIGGIEYTHLAKANYWLERHWDNIDGTPGLALKPSYTAPVTLFIPAGGRKRNNAWDGIGSHYYFWLSTRYSNSSSNYYERGNHIIGNRYMSKYSGGIKSDGLSLRCVK
jgi:uncharacterized protein (TIGR02145 family)